MTESNSISRLIVELKAGDQEAARRIWSLYVTRLIRIANAQLATSPKRVADEDDVVVAAFAAFFKGVECGRFSRLSDRNDLWQILVMLTERQAINQTRAERAKKRGGGQVRGDSVNDIETGAGFSQKADPSPTPAFAMQASEELHLLLSRLKDEGLKRVALRKLEGFTNKEIAKELGRAVCTVERKLKRIREIWTEDISSADSKERIVDEPSRVRT